MGGLISISSAHFKLHDITWMRNIHCFLFHIETFTNAPSSDLKPVVLEVFVYLMRAQARECIYKRLQMKNHRDYETLLIETQCLMREYRKIHDDIQSNTEVNFPACWEALVPLKQKYYEAISHVYFAKNTVLTIDITDEHRLKTIKAHLQASQSCHEEILRIQRMCRELRVSLWNINLLQC